MNGTLRSPPAGCTVTRLTPSGRGAIATISVEGGTAVRAVESLFQPHRRRSFATVPIDHILVGSWRGHSGCTEEVVVVRRSPTRVEIHCHGGLAASEAIVHSLTVVGASIQSQDEWLDRRIADPIQRAAWRSLGRARTERTAAILLDQWRGSLSTAVRETIGWLRHRPARLDAAAQRLDQLLQLAEVGRHLTQPWRVVLAGPPNVGKSSLVNAILGYERSIVFDLPGTTRDVLTAVTAIDGWPVELSDTAGYRDSTDVIEREGTRRAWSKLQEADLAILVTDVCQPAAPCVTELQAVARNSLVVVNKSDLFPASSDFPSAWLRTSALHGTGIAELIRRLAIQLVPRIPLRGEAVPFTFKQYALLVEAHCGVMADHATAAAAALERLLHD